ncbi:MAG: NusA-like transcription termination signal-binding factor [Nitrososphaeria archaeon]|nr:NusA-like transcription termination signal-binding factor [Nitrososphaeria archaeon]NIN52774.1 NusA-like transcription termination signal-binding factor [Nitrososphaeria archaeon]NIQ32885.1 NusA-like transcription termination signal-binding factor [Nitrososphaeria archaeon]
MLRNTKLTADELALISLFESITGVGPVDCILDNDRVTFLIHEKDFPSLLRMAFTFSSAKKKSIGLVLEELSRIMKRKVDIVKFSDNIKRFIINFFSLAKSESVKIISRPDGYKYAIINVNPRRRGAVIGRGGYRAKQGRELTKRYFGLQTIYIR